MPTAAHPAAATAAKASKKTSKSAAKSSKASSDPSTSSTAAKSTNDSIDIKNIPLQISDYLILPVSLPPLSCMTKVAGPDAVYHFLYVRPHEPKVPTPTAERSLFVVNVPIDATEAHFRALFADHLGGGRVESVEFEGRRSESKGNVAPMVAEGGLSVSGKKRKRGGQEDDAALMAMMRDPAAAVDLPDTWDRQLHRSGSSAVVTFVDRASMDLALKAIKKSRKSGQAKIVWGEGVEGTGKVPELGIHRYMAHQMLRYPDPDDIKASVNTFMERFSNMEAARDRMRARLRNQADEDGFVTVTRGGRAGPARQEEALEKLEKQKEKSKGKEDFYRFQLREKRKEKAAEMLRKFDEDKKKIEEMRRKRGKFRPE
ncbi:hypothetical protein L228DRAFT_266609 [Xylona heveae TC161]|uniref:RRM domain-containing protein n=1 Tax=Xylona heveae (strain CBS 132557 / TC161) TaxID=1328760 RepID=A0A165I285_XYLHT|nr:hypothetical protein L228DRAFT_266609 [Xylona heveae TC161]KZF24260.1 hypothetical protein L228DRAFT_266609 [Xylona heveae TC161]